MPPNEVNIKNKGISVDNVEIQEALKEFEMKSAGEQRPVQEVSETSEAPKIVKLVVKCSGGLIKEESQAYYVLFGFVVLAIIVSLFLVFGGGGNTQLSPQALEQMKQHMPVFNSN